MKILAKDPLLKSIRTVARETGEKVGKKGALTDSEREALGSRAEIAGRLGWDAFDESLDSDRLPAYFPDIEECLERCNIGATYVEQWQGGPVTLRCLNKDHFEEKLARGREVYQKQLAATLEANNEADARLVADLEARLTDSGLAQLLSTALIGALDFLPLSPEGGRDFEYYPDVATKAVEQLGVKVTEYGFGHSPVDRAEAIAAIRGLDGAAGEVAANLIVWALREGSENGELDIDALTELVTGAETKAGS